MDFETVVEKIGEGVQLRACERLGVHPSTLSSWKRRGSIPNWRQDQIRRIAKDLGIELSERKTEKAA